MKKLLRATKSMKYGTRRLVAGDEFEASSRDAHILLGLRNSKVEAAERANTRIVTSAQKPLAPQGEAVIYERDHDDGDKFVDKLALEQLRSEAQELGIPVDGRWGPHRLRAEIAAKRRVTSE